MFLSVDFIKIRLILRYVTKKKKENRTNKKKRTETTTLIIVIFTFFHLTNVAKKNKKRVSDVFYSEINNYLMLHLIFNIFFSTYLLIKKIFAILVIYYHKHDKHSFIVTWKNNVNFRFLFF